jgi:hypothetical protein
MIAPISNSAFPVNGATALIPVGSGAGGSPVNIIIHNTSGVTITVGFTPAVNTTNFQVVSTQFLSITVRNQPVYLWSPSAVTINVIASPT